MFNFFNKTEYTFEGKKEAETVIMFLHRHWFTLANKVVLMTVLFLLPILLFVLFGQILLSNNLIPLFTFFWAAYIMGLWFFLFFSLTMYTLDYWIVTNERIVDSKQMGFFNRRISELSIHMIQDISAKLVGFIPTLMNFGAVEIQTAAEQRNFLFDQVPAPQIVKDKIMEIIEKTEDELGPRMHGMTQRHHFHPDKYVIRRISENTKDELSEAENGTNSLTRLATENQEYSQPEPVTLDNSNIMNNGDERRHARNTDDTVPPNLPI